MAITVQSGTGASVTSPATTITPSLPASVNAGDLLIALVDQSTDVTATSPGYTSAFHDAIAGDGFHVLTKTAGGSESAPLITFGSGVSAVAIMVRVRDCDNTPAQLTAQASSTTTASIDPPTAGSVKIAVVHVDPFTAGTVTWTGGATDLGAMANSNVAYVAAAYKLEDSAGAVTFTTTISGSPTPGTLIFSIAPGAAVATFVPQIIVS